jgi:predicted dehydrogenase
MPQPLLADMAFHHFDLLRFIHCLARYQVADSQKVRLQGLPLSEQAYILADFMAARREDRQPRTSVFDNLRSLAMVMAAIDAVKTGQIVAVSNNEIEELVQASRE